jgi:hypothetical protein
MHFSVLGSPYIIWLSPFLLFNFIRLDFCFHFCHPVQQELPIGKADGINLNLHFSFCQQTTQVVNCAFQLLSIQLEAVVDRQFQPVLTANGDAPTRNFCLKFLQPSHKLIGIFRRAGMVRALPKGRCLWLNFDCGFARRFPANIPTMYL